METSDKTFADVVKLLTSWLPRRSNPDNVSRDFWMPDHSCRVCYDCDTQFTIFNRRHHCRRCGRIFCGKCTTNSILASSGADRNIDEGDRIRVCNFCFKQWEQEKIAALKQMMPALSPSLSEASLFSTKSTITINSVSTTAGSYSTGHYQHVAHASSISPPKISEDKASHNMLDTHVPDKSMSTVSIKDETSSVQYGYYTNRSDDEEEECAAYCSDRQVQHHQHDDHYYGPDEFDELESSYNPTAVEENVISKEVSPHAADQGFPSTLPATKVEDEPDPDNSSECGAASSIYALESTDTNPLDFEKNELFWFPPEPEDEEDEMEVGLFDDDDDDEPVGDTEQCRIRSSSSFGSGEFRNRDRSSEEHKKVMKNVVDGHFRALISQLLQVENISLHEGDETGWLEIVTSVSWEAANFLRPDTSQGGGMDPGGYVKVKCLACGHRSESTVVKGVVCKKNVAHRRMTSRIEKPRLLLLAGALEYQRVTNQLSSIDTLLQQETDHLKMTVAKIVAQKPNLLLVEHSVSRYAQDLLLEKNISLVLNIKRPLLHRIARCTNAHIVPSIDLLPSQKLGHCELFYVDKYVEHSVNSDNTTKRMPKTMMFFEGCPKPLGCTVLLKGGSMDELKKIKHVVQYGIFAAYHLALETSFLADEGATLPEIPLKSPLTVALPDNRSTADNSISTVPGFIFNVPNSQQPTDGFDHLITGSVRSTGPDGIAVPPLSSECSTKIQTTYSHSSGTWSANGGTWNSKTIDELEKVTATTTSGPTCGIPMNHSHIYSTIEKNWYSGDYHGYGSTRPDGKTMMANLTNSNSSCHHGTSEASTNISNSANLKEPFDVSIDLANVENVTNNNVVMVQPVLSTVVQNQETNHGHESTSNKEEIMASDHQSILVSLSIRCVWKGTICQRSHMLRIKYYGNFDKPLGRFLRDCLFNQGYQCISCDKPPEAHVYCYTHQQGSLTISVKKLTEFVLPGERDGKIWMWHRCLKCPWSNGFPPATLRIVMSDAAWGLSLGKFLELSFSNHAAASRVASCGHSLHRDCLRFYGFGKMVACFRYAPINVHSIHVPPHKLDFSHQPLDWIQKEANEVIDRAKVLFDEISRALHHHSDKKAHGSSLNMECNNHIADLEGMLRKEKSEFEGYLNKVLKKETHKVQPDILEINRLRRQLLFHSYLWDQRLISAARSDRNRQELCSFKPTDKEIVQSIDIIAEENATENPQNEISTTETSSNDPKNVEYLQHSIDGGNSPGVDPCNCCPSHDQQIAISESDSIQRGNKTPLYSSVSVNVELAPLESDILARRTLSEGQFPSLLDVSNALDAKWTGENDPVTSSATLPDCVTSSEDSEEHVTDTTPSYASVLLNKLGDSAEDQSNWIGMPFLQFYRSLNKQWSRSYRFDALNEYTPVHVSFLRTVERQVGPKFLFPIGVNDTVVGVYDDEPTSIISYALASHEYHLQLSDELESDTADNSLSVIDSRSASLTESVEETTSELLRSFVSTDDSILYISGSKNPSPSDPLAYRKVSHIKVNFGDEGPLGQVKYTVICYYAKQFDALRRICCPSERDFVRSLSRCKKWGAQGGKSNVFFAKSLDDRFIIKQVTKTELESFMKFAREYFGYVSESIVTGSPTCIAKILGIYQVKSLKGGKEVRMDVLVMENLLFERHVTRLYDLKGSTRSRYNPDSNGSNTVLLDQNLIEAMPTSPIFVGNKAKRLLERAVWNDTAFLASIDVMDYSLLVGVDEKKHELVMGIIDFMRQYTWDKHLETWVKTSGILGGPKNVAPTVISPKQYKKRFRKAMSTYFLVVPDQWSPPAVVPSKQVAESNQDDD
ncbi:1-phosphatidylinositol-3-phosphate 5-kinase FAB1A-like isoform X1 [Oryza brachyantha]|uniref:1-phosphatidylinositol-3-phosphate 5-kinase FAB1A-like isoform X1 n=1 Tax=Oryza brachyantha TaxID=4533 RepID=UPI0003EA92F2|nr:1-phosphatidylinositol-3-phosphate 5-kinase FAB1A-like isoform X1 [Oryza brachyantha]XP_040377609.1 1-phosphatidylinositol-3-phosphate 5-kinase FAB1A-like isoform X1 [Oryza brachyantha]XP_040377610.1 1-phosphatidylinositol-3-phosphate 5-kinase FAB1A-like isoform X1 [Oryza brachyantha]